MAIVEMQKIRLYIHKGETSSVLRALQKLGVVEFTDVSIKDLPLKQREKVAFEFNYVSSRLDFAVDFLSKYAPKKKGLRGAIEGDRVFATGSKIYKIANSFYYNDTIDAAQTLEEKLNNAKTKIKALQDEKALLTNWTNLKIPLSTPLETEKTLSIYITAEPGSIEGLERALSDKKILYNIQNVTDTNKVLTYLKEDHRKLEKHLREYDIETVTLPKRRGTPADEIDRIDRAVAKEEQKMERREKRAVKLAKKLPKIKMVADYMYWQKQKHDLISKSVMTEDVIVFEGWCPKNKIKAVKECIDNKTNQYALEEIDPGEDEVIPVEIENNALIKPFEMVTRLYGLPGSKDLDPTVFLASFFFIFFGMSLTDVGYGFFLFALTASIMFFFRVPHDIKPFIKLMMFGGISSILLGLLFGGYLGIDMMYMPAWVQALQKFDPINSPIAILGLALALGVVQILFGLVLKIVRDAKQGNLKDGILDQGPWIAIFLTLIALAAHKGGILAGNSNIYVWLVYAAFASLVLTNGRKEKGIVKKALKGLLGLYDSIGYFSDVLSYSRLLALGLATSALAFAVNLIAFMVKDVPYVGWILVIAILIVGHLFNLAVNLLGAFIHSARLQFVEFFGKFITETGRNFKPFKREERNVVIDG